jgi:hypothetical protein
MILAVYSIANMTPKNKNKSNKNLKEIILKTLIKSNKIYKARNN